MKPGLIRGADAGPVGLGQALGNVIGRTGRLGFPRSRRQHRQGGEQGEEEEMAGVHKKATGGVAALREWRRKLRQGAYGMRLSMR